MKPKTKIIKILKNKLLINITICLVFLFIVRITLGFNNVFAQAINLSITPPLTEIIVMPGKEAKQIYSISNLGGDTYLTPKIVNFVPEDNLGNVLLTDIASPDWIRFHEEPFLIRSGESKNFTVLFSPPQGFEEKDYYLTLLFQTGDPIDLVGKTTSLHTGQIGSNILLTVSSDGNPKKEAKIITFSAPKIVDSLFPVNYQVVVKNTGNSYFKPNGNITITEGKTQTILPLAPLNIIPGYERKIFCMDEENLVECSLNKKPIMGVYKATISFNLDETSIHYEEEIKTFAFPFSGTFLLILSFFLYRLFQKRLTRKIKSS